ncbi:hypothetical protein H310_06342 [Aphanomyces invadans]|uniref:Amino acid permease/ SLC12A domain-containing protein n=1 Tax=Aphanomyces invadans TaxID=157072 RepID=A0A024U766_9STRA|nr:hypothetical protein H310_06342 [Aphanomyces invadans]ETW01737.1 hypothetical protein H310_06342 [Aphanomyces invadans]|eukprot:XP_008869585.1 hypothetical protein H310_06342 [Aphanomyces invadans]
MQVQPVATSAATPVAKATTAQIVSASFNLWAVGITVVIGGQYFSWNVGLSAGTVSYGIASIMMTCAYMCMCLCMAEVSSMVVFEGGAFGLARCTWGFYAGFIIGCCEGVQYILYVTCSFVALGRMVAAFWPLIVDHPYVSWFLSYVLSSAMLIVGGRVYWRWNMMLALVSFLILVVYVCGSLPYVDIAAHGGGSAYYFVGGFAQFMAVFPLTAWYYVGVESLNRLCAEVVEPRVTVPIGQLACMLTLVTTAVFVFFVTISINPGMPDVATSLAPMNHGFNRMFNCTDDVSMWLALPATFATGQGFVQAYTKVISCMSGSHLLPAILHRKHAGFQTPTYAIVVTSAISFGLCFVDYYCALDAVLFNTCIFLGCISYLSQCVGYIYLKKNFRTMERKFRSPVGKAGAIYAIAIWVVTMIAILGFQGDAQASFLFVLGILGVATVYYHIYAKHKQTFSDEERKALFFAHVANHNNSKRSHHSRGKGKPLSTLLKKIGLKNVSTTPLRPSTNGTSTTAVTADPNVRHLGDVGAKKKRSSGASKGPSMKESQSSRRLKT